MKRLLCVFLMLALLFSCAAAENTIERNDRLKERAQRIAAQLYAGEFDAIASEFSEYMASFATSQDVEALWQQMQPYLGGFVARKNVSGSIVKGYGMVTLRDEFEKDTLILQINFDGADKIFGIQMQLENTAIEYGNPSETEFAQEMVDQLVEESITLSEALLAGNYAMIVNRLSEEVRGGSDEAAIDGIWKEIAPVLGEYVQRGEIRAGMDSGYLLVIVQEEFSENVLNVQFVYDGDAQLVGFHFRTNISVDIIR